MSKWANALGQGLAAVAKVGSDALDQQMKTDATIAAEQRAADQKLAVHERQLAIEEAMKNRAGERFTKIYSAKASEDIPLEAPGVEQTGLTRDSAIAPDPEKGVVGADFAQSPEQLAALEAQFNAVLTDPNASEQQRTDAREVLAALAAQKGNQKTVNAKSVEGKTRKRTDTEAARAALAEAAGSDFGAHTAGSGAWRDAFTREDNQKKDAAAAADKDADRASREKVAGIQVDARRDIAGAETERKTAADKARNETAQARIDALVKTQAAKAGNKSALVQNIDYLRDVLKYSPEQIEQFIFEKKGISVGELAAKILTADKFNDMTPEQAAVKARSLMAAVDGSVASAAPAAAAPAAGAPKRMKLDPVTGKIQ